MSVPDSGPEDSSAAVQTPHSVFVIAACEVCGGPLGPRALNSTRPQVVCSSRCRGIRWRRQGEAMQQAELESLGQAVRELRGRLDALAARVEQMTVRASRRE